MSASLHVPLSISAKTREGLTLALLRVQGQEGGKVTVVSIYYDAEKGEHVLWYYPLKYFGGGLL